MSKNIMDPMTIDNSSWTYESLKQRQNRCQLCSSFKAGETALNRQAQKGEADFGSKWV